MPVATYLRISVSRSVSSGIGSLWSCRGELGLDASELSEDEARETGGEDGLTRGGGPHRREELLATS